MRSIPLQIPQLSKGLCYSCSVLDLLVRWLASFLRVPRYWPSLDRRPGPHVRLALIILLEPNRNRPVPMAPSFLQA